MCTKVLGSLLVQISFFLPMSIDETRSIILKVFLKCSATQISLKGLFSHSSSETIRSHDAKCKNLYDFCHTLN